MNAISPHLGALRNIFEHPHDGIVGIVDGLLKACQEHALHLEWTSERFRVRSNGGDWEELTDLRLRTSVVRAILARIAALCNVQKPDSVSPYGGRGKLSVAGTLPTILEVSFVNTPSEQTLELALATLQPPKHDERHGEIGVRTYSHGDENMI